MQVTISAPTAKILYKLVEKYHHDAEALYHSAGLSKSDLTDVHKRISYQTLHSLWQQASQLIDDPCFGLAGVEIWHPSDLNALGYAWLTSSTLRTAVGRFCRFLEVATGFYQLRTQETDESFELIFDFLDKKTLNMAQADASMAIVMEMCRVNYEQTLEPIMVTLTHSQPECYYRYESYYACPVAFSQAENKIILSTQVMDQPLFNRDPNLALINDKAMIAYLQKHCEQDIVQKVKRTITEELSSGVSIGQVASVLNMTERTLHRRLKEQSITFKEILQDVRIELSQLYIKNDQYNITDIAFQLGFSDSSAFSRAFKRWTGSSPATFRQVGE